MVEVLYNKPGTGNVTVYSKKNKSGISNATVYGEGKNPSVVDKYKYKEKEELAPNQRRLPNGTIETTYPVIGTADASGKIGMTSKAQIILESINHPDAQNPTKISAIPTSQELSNKTNRPYVSNAKNSIGTYQELSRQQEQERIQRQQEINKQVIAELENQKLQQERVAKSEYQTTRVNEINAQINAIKSGEVKPDINQYGQVTYNSMPTFYIQQQNKPVYDSNYNLIGLRNEQTQQPYIFKQPSYQTNLKPLVPQYKEVNGKKIPLTESEKEWLATKKQILDNKELSNEEKKNIMFSIISEKYKDKLDNLRVQSTKKLFSSSSNTSHFIPSENKIQNNSPTNITNQGSNLSTTKLHNDGVVNAVNKDIALIGIVGTSLGYVGLEAIESAVTKPVETATVIGGLSAISIASPIVGGVATVGITGYSTLSEPTTSKKITAGIGNIGLLAIPIATKKIFGKSELPADLEFKKGTDIKYEQLSNKQTISEDGSFGKLNLPDSEKITIIESKQQTAKKPFEFWKSQQQFDVTEVTTTEGKIITYKDISNPERMFVISQPKNSLEATLFSFNNGKLKTTKIPAIQEQQAMQVMELTTQEILYSQNQKEVPALFNNEIKSAVSSLTQESVVKSDFVVGQELPNNKILVGVIEAKGTAVSTSTPKEGNIFTNKEQIQKVWRSDSKVEPVLTKKEPTKLKIVDKPITDEKIIVSREFDYPINTESGLQQKRINPTIEKEANFEVFNDIRKNHETSDSFILQKQTTKPTSLIVEEQRTVAEGTFKIIDRPKPKQAVESLTTPKKEFKQIIADKSLIEYQKILKSQKQNKPTFEQPIEPEIGFRQIFAKEELVQEKNTVQVQKTTAQLPEQTVKFSQSIQVQSEQVNIPYAYINSRTEGIIKQPLQDKKIESPTKILNTRFNIDQEPILLSRNKSEIKSENKLNYNFKNETKINTKSRIEIKPLIETISGVKQEQKLNTKSEVKLEPKLEQKQEQKLEPKLEQKLINKPIVKPKTEIYPFINIKPEIREPPRIIKLKFDSDKKSESGYNVFVRKGGIFSKANPLPLSKQEAINLGAVKVGNTASATFKLEETNQEATGSFKGIGISSDFSINKKGEYIERLGRRIKSSGELQEITFKGIASLKNSKRAFI